MDGLEKAVNMPVSNFFMQITIATQGVQRHNVVAKAWQFIKNETSGGFIAEYRVFRSRVVSAPGSWCVAVRDILELSYSLAQTGCDRKCRRLT